MRTIKFRAWDGKRMAYQQPDNWFYPNLDTDKRISQSLSLSTVFLQKCITMMQFTGLKDKNGKDVYEGDVFGEDWLTGDDGYEPTSKVYFDNDLSSFCIELTSGGWEYLHKYLSETKKAEVIGNIHENPDLLTL